MYVNDDKLYMLTDVIPVLFRSEVFTFYIVTIFRE